MSGRTGIAWTDHTFNPWWGCTRVSPGCAHCYASDLAERYGFELWRPDGQRRFFTARHWRDPVTWNRQAEAEGRRHRVFCASMADVFEDHPALEEPRGRLFDLIEATPWLDWQLLTKRPQNFGRFLPPLWTKAPRPNVWLGVSAEDQQRADERIPLLLQPPAAVRFVSAEPLLGPVDITYWLGVHALTSHGRPVENGCGRLDWIIVGGESGSRARVCNLDWVRSIAAQCKAAGVACFVKQLGARALGEDDAVYGSAIPVPAHAETWAAALRDRKGGDPMEWPEDLRVREFPCVRRD